METTRCTYVRPTPHLPIAQSYRYLVTRRRRVASARRAGTWLHYAAARPGARARAAGSRARQDFARQESDAGAIDSVGPGAIGPSMNGSHGR